MTLQHYHFRMPYDHPYGLTGSYESESILVHVLREALAKQNLYAEITSINGLHKIDDCVRSGWLVKCGDGYQLTPKAIELMYSYYNSIAPNA